MSTIAGAGTGRSAGPQLRPLIALRWRMVRSPRTRRWLLVAATVPLLLCVAAVAVGQLLPRTDEADSLLFIVPTLLLGFLLLSIITPLAAGGGNELYPADQLVGLPIRSRTVALAALVLAPLNLAWLLQVLLSLALVSYAARSGTLPTIAAATTILAYVVMVTTLGQSVGWLVVGVRQTDAGRVASWVALGVLAGGFLVLLKTERLTGVLDASPTTWVLAASLRPAAADYGEWLARSALLLGLAAVFAWTSMAACTWALRQPDKRRGRRTDRTAIDARTQTWTTRPRTDRHGRTIEPSVASLRRRIDRSGVWRSPPLRRGVLILSLLPAAALLVAGSDAALLLLLPGLVAAGSALLFAVNAFCLDGPGAPWLASMPGDPATWFWGRARVVAEVATLTVLPLVAVGTLRLPTRPSLTLALSVVVAAASSIAWVTAMCMRASVTRPHRALLLGPRDTPAPPGAMAVHSLRLSASSTGIGLLLALAAVTGLWWFPLLMGVALLPLAARSLIRTSALWADPVIRSRVITVVAAG